jgi:hypothetical protein
MQLNLKFDWQERAIFLGNFWGLESVVWLEAAIVATGWGVDPKRKGLRGRLVAQHDEGEFNVCTYNRRKG